MVVKREISFKRYIIAAIITFLIFSLGIMLGLIMDYERLSYLEKTSKVEDLNYKSLQLQYLYITNLENTESSCSILKAALKNSIEDLSYSLDQYEKYEKDSQINKKDYEIVARDYLLDNIRYWIFSKRTKEVCDNDVINVLYFYSLNTCPICNNQGTILSYFKAKLEDQILIFPINVDLDEDFIKILKLQYNVTSLPTIIINDDKYEGVVSREKLSQIICSSSQNKEKCQI